MKSLLVAAAVAATAVAAPASAATFTFNFANNGPTSTTAASGSGSSALGNAFTYTQTVGGETLSVRITAFSILGGPGGTYSIAQLARFGGAGLGVINPNENGSNNSHTVDTLGSNDFLLFQFNKVVDPFQASSIAYTQDGERDNDLVAIIGSTAQAWNTRFTAGQVDNGTGITLAGGHLAENTGSSNPVLINPLDRTGNLLFIAAGGSDNLTDSLKLSSLTVATVPVPEPATWAMMIAGFGLVGAGMRRRSGVTATRVTA